jgi:hypothetical protein
MRNFFGVLNKSQGLHYSRPTARCASFSQVFEITKVQNSLSGMFAMNFEAHGRAMVFQLEHGFRV